MGNVTSGDPFPGLRLRKKEVVGSVFSLFALVSYTVHKLLGPKGLCGAKSESAGGRCWPAVAGCLAGLAGWVAGNRLLARSYKVVRILPCAPEPLMCGSERVDYGDTGETEDWLQLPRKCNLETEQVSWLSPCAPGLACWAHALSPPRCAATLRGVAL